MSWRYYNVAKYFALYFCLTTFVSSFWENYLNGINCQMNANFWCNFYIKNKTFFHSFVLMKKYHLLIARKSNSYVRDCWRWSFCKQLHLNRVWIFVSTIWEEIFAWVEIGSTRTLSRDTFFRNTTLIGVEAAISWLISQFDCMLLVQQILTLTA